MGSRWQYALVTGLILIGVAAIAAPGMLPAVRGLVAITMLGLGHRHLSGHSGKAVRPWRLILTAGAVALCSAIVRLVHASIADVEYPYPSPADLLAYLSYLVMLAGGVSLVRARTLERIRADVVDSIVVAATAALLLYVFVLSDYLVDPAIPAFDRLGNLGYSLLTMGIVGVTARVSFGPGVRNGSYYLLAAAAFLIVVNDVLLLLDTVGRPGTFAVASVVAPLAFTFITASLLHPGSLELANRPEYREQHLTRPRIGLLLAAVVTGPLVVLLEEIRESPQHLAVVLSLWVVITTGVLLRMFLIVFDRDAMTRQERALRDLAATLTTLQSPTDITTASLDAGLALLDKGSGARVALYEERDGGVWAVAAASGRGASVLHGLELAPEAAAPFEAAHARGIAISYERTHPLELPPMASAVDAEAFVVVAPVVSRQRSRMCLTVTSQRLIRREQVAGLTSLAGQLSLALDGMHLAEQLHNRRANRRFRALVENSSDIVLVLDDEAVVGFVSPTVRRLLGRDEAQVLHHPVLELVHRPDQVHVRRLVAAPTRVGSSHSSVEVRLLHGSGELRWFELEARDLTGEDEVQGVVITARDISDRRRAEAQLMRSEARFRLMVQNSSDVVAIVDDDSLLTYVSPSVEKMLGFGSADVLGRNVFELLSITEAERLRNIDIADMSGRSIEVRIQGADGRVRAVEVGVTDMRSQPEVDGIVLNIRDVTERKSLEDDLRHQALHDDLTGLANRTLFAERIRDGLRTSTHTGGIIAVLFIDLDDFKLINDSLGHVVGDQILVSIADRIQQCLRLSDVAARLGGDEFAVLLTGVYGDSEVIEIAERIRQSISTPLRLGDNQFRLTASIGVASDTSGTRTDEDLLRAADLAMYQAKQHGKDRYALFQDHMAESAFEELELKTALARALENDEFVVHYQPIVDMATSQISGVEALIRWEDPTRGMISPASFIPTAEETGLIRPIGMWVAQQAATDLARWRDAGFDLSCSINVSGKQFGEDDFAEKLIDRIRSTGVDLTKIVIELTESVLADEGVAEVFDAFHDVGFRIALDDFGTGYSALQYLQKFDIDLIKIDRSFVKALNTDTDAGVVEAVLDVARRINAKSVAEGIEDTAELRKLKQLGVDYGQGYYFSKPVPAEKLRVLLDEQLVGEASTPTT